MGTDEAVSVGVETFPVADDVTLGVTVAVEAPPAAAAPLPGDSAGVGTFVAVATVVAVDERFSVVEGVDVDGVVAVATPLLPVFGGVPAEGLEVVAVALLVAGEDVAANVSEVIEETVEEPIGTDEAISVGGVTFATVDVVVAGADGVLDDDAPVVPAFVAAAVTAGTAAASPASLFDGDETELGAVGVPAVVDCGAPLASTATEPEVPAAVPELFPITPDADDDAGWLEVVAAPGAEDVGVLLATAVVWVGVAAELFLFDALAVEAALDVFDDSAAEAAVSEAAPVVAVGAVAVEFSVVAGEAAFVTATLVEAADAPVSVVTGVAVAETEVVSGTAAADRVVALVDAVAVLDTVAAVSAGVATTAGSAVVVAPPSAET